MSGKTALDVHTLRPRLEKYYRSFNRPEYIHPDPLEFVLKFDDPADQEIAGLVASGLAYGRVGQILKSLERVFGVLRDPASDLTALTRGELLDAFHSFRHRWTTGEEMAFLLRGISVLREEYGSLEACFLKGLNRRDGDVVPALAGFVQELRLASGRSESSLLVCPSMGSACKRMFLYLRWMVRRDAVDPGPWENVAPSRLVVPVDVHMHRMCLKLGLTGRRQADLKTAREVTDSFRLIAPSDPVKYDFALTRFGIKPDWKTADITGCPAPEAGRVC